MITNLSAYEFITQYQEEMREEARQARVAADYRREHPELRFRARFAHWLRAWADRLATDSAPRSNCACA